MSTELVDEVTQFPEAGGQIFYFDLLTVKFVSGRVFQLAPVSLCIS